VQSLVKAERFLAKRRADCHNVGGAWTADSIKVVLGQHHSSLVKNNSLHIGMPLLFILLNI